MAEDRRRSSRDVKETAVHNVPRSEVPVPGLIISAGLGKAIGQLPCLVRRLNAMKNNDPVLKLAFTVMFPGQLYTKERAKSSIQFFNGLSAGSDHVATTFLKSFGLKDLSAFGRLVDITPSKRIPTVVERLVCFLKSPAEADLDPKVVKKPKSAKRKPAPVETVKTPLPQKSVGGYWHFCIVNKTALEQAHPEKTVSLLTFQLTSLFFKGSFILPFHIAVFVFTCFFYMRFIPTGYCFCDSSGYYVVRDEHRGEGSVGAAGNS